jgi:N-acetylmuramic acid 6-phosphate etherase
MADSDLAMTPAPASKPLRVLGIEGGGTKTEWHLGEWSGGACAKALQTGRLPASNLKLFSDEYLGELFSVLPDEADAVGVYLAGCATETDRERLLLLACRRWPNAQIQIGSDRESALAACFGAGDGIAVIAGTGAAVHGRVGAHIERAGGWGQLLGDRGSGYHLAMQALRHVLSDFDLTGEVSALGQAVLRNLALTRLLDLVDWVTHADKMSVARLAPALFECARSGSEEARHIIDTGAQILVDFTTAVARRLERPDLPVALFGGLFAHHPEYAELFGKKLAALLPGATLHVVIQSGALGAAWLAAHALRDAGEEPPEECAQQNEPALPADRASLAHAATEQHNPRSANLDALSTPDLVDLFIAEEEYVAGALTGASASISQAIDLAGEMLHAGGRLFYAGAGTSGRLGVLDASEIPPTFGVSAELVQGIMAGGFTALHRAVEGAEDQPAAGALAVIQRGVRAGDVLCGIAASGRTPFVLGALQQARTVGAKTILLTCNPARGRAALPWDVEIDLATGPELVTGSTRLKAGTATKLVLNLLSTGAMIRLGRVHGNSMVDLQITNEKLRDRGVRLVSATLHLDYAEALRRLEAAHWNVRRVLETLGRT